MTPDEAKAAWEETKRASGWNPPTWTPEAPKTAPRAPEKHSSVLAEAAIDRVKEILAVGLMLLLSRIFGC